MLASSARFVSFSGSLSSGTQDEISKKRMKSIGRVDIPQKAFMAVLDTGDDKGK